MAREPYVEGENPELDILIKEDISTRRTLSFWLSALIHTLILQLCTGHFKIKMDEIPKLINEGMQFIGLESHWFIIIFAIDTIMLYMITLHMDGGKNSIIKRCENEIEIRRRFKARLIKEQREEPEAYKILAGGSSDSDD